MATKLNNVSILTAGEAKGHNLLIDETSLQQALSVAQSMGRIKVTNGHGAQQVMDILGYVENFKVQGNRLLGDLTLLDNDKASYVASLANIMPDQFGLSLTFSGVPEDKEDGQRYARVTEIYDVSVVTTPAANPAGMFSAFSRLPVDTFVKQQMDTPIAEVKKEELSAPAVAPEIKAETPATPAPEAPKAELAEAPAAPAPAVETKAAEPTLGDIAGMLAEILGYMKKDKAEDVAEMPAEDMAAKKDEKSEMAAQPVAEKTEFNQKVEKDAAGAAPVPAQHADAKVSRAEILTQFNQEQSPAKRVALLRKLGV
jgi:hypothetical protein